MKYIITICGFLICLQVQAQQNKIKPSLNHTAIFVVDLATSGNFYSNIIGLDTVPEPFHDGRHIWYKTGEHTMLHVIQGATAKKEYFKNQHTCFTVSNINDFVNQLKKNNWIWEDKDGKKLAITNRIDGVHQLWVQDPDGYWIEINDDKF